MNKLLSSYEGTSPMENEKMDQYRLKCPSCGYIDMQEEHYKGDLCPECSDSIKTVQGICPSCDEPSLKEHCEWCSDDIELKEYDLYNEEWV